MFFSSDPEDGQVRTEANDPSRMHCRLLGQSGGQMISIKAGRKMLFTMSKGFMVRLLMYQLGEGKKSALIGLCPWWANPKKGRKRPMGYGKEYFHQKNF